MCEFLFWLALYVAAVWEISLHLLELRHLGKMQKGLFPFPGLPQAMPSFGNLDNSIAYARNRVKLSLGETLTNYILCVAIAAYGVPDRISQLIGNVVNSQGLIAGLSGLVLCFLFWSCNLPWAWLRTFRVERKYGFNLTTKMTFARDKLIGLILLTSVSFASLFYFALIFRYPLWPLYLMLTLFLFEFIIMLVAPVIILPLFFKLQPLMDEDLAFKIRGLLDKLGIRNFNIYVADASRRTLHGNAFIAGMGKVKRIVLFDTLLSRLKADEVCAVLAHELGHWKLRHIGKRLVLLWAVQATLILCAYLMWSFGFVQALHIQSPQAFAVYVFVFLNAFMTLAFQPLILHVSRKHELEADRFAAESLDRESVIQALSKISRDNLSWLPSSKIYAMWYSTHPSILERITILNQ